MPKIQLPEEWRQGLERRNTSGAAQEHELFPWRRFLDAHAPTPLPSLGGNYTGYLPSRSPDFHARSSFLASVVIMSIFLLTTLGATAVLLAFCRKRNTVFALSTNDARSQYELAHMDDDISQCSSTEEKTCARSRTYPEFPQSLSMGDLRETTLTLSPAPPQRGERRNSELNGSAISDKFRQSEPTLPLLPRSHTVTFPVRSKRARGHRASVASPGPRQGEVIGKFCAMTSAQARDLLRGYRPESRSRDENSSLCFPHSANRSVRAGAHSAFRPYQPLPFSTDLVAVDCRGSELFGGSACSMSSRTASDRFLFHDAPADSSTGSDDICARRALDEFPSERFDLFSHVCEQFDHPKTDRSETAPSRCSSSPVPDNRFQSADQEGPLRSHDVTSGEAGEGVETEACSIQEGDLAACPGFCQLEGDDTPESSRFHDVRRSEIIGDVRRSEIIGDVRRSEIIGDVRRSEIIGDDRRSEIIGDVRRSEIIGDVRRSEIIGDVRRSEIIGDVRRSEITGDVRLRAFEPEGEWTDNEADDAYLFDQTSALLK